MKQKSSQEILGLGFTVFKTNSHKSTVYNSRSDTAKLISFLNSQTDETSNSYNANSTEWEQLQLAVCEKKYSIWSHEIPQKLIDKTIKELQKHYITSTKRYEEQFNRWEVMRKVGAYSFLLFFLDLMILAPFVFICGIMEVSKLFMSSTLLYFLYLGIAFLALAILLCNAGYFGQNQESFFTKEIKPFLIEEEQNKEIEMDEFSPISA